MPTPRKAIEDRTGHHAAPDELAPLTAAPVIPRPPMGLSAGLRRTWDGLWSSPVARLLDPVSDLPVVSRLFYLYKLSDRVARQIAVADPDRLAFLMEDDDPTEETKRLIAEIAAALAAWHATIATQVKLATEIRQVEQTIGVSPKARLALGVALAGQDPDAIGALMDD
jgi:hypothetical protein